MRCAFLAAHVQSGEVLTYCRALGVAPSTYYAWIASQRQTRRRHADGNLVAALRLVHEESLGTYGRPQLTTALKRRGFAVGERRVARLQRELGLWGGQRAIWRRTAAMRRARRCGGDAVAPNRLARNFAVGAVNARWACDTTWIPTRDGPRTLAVVLDVGSRRVVGWAVGPQRTSVLTIRALRAALARRQPAPGLLHHSDQGEEYLSLSYRAELAAAGIELSMNRVGNCWDNAVVESFFATLKAEIVPQTPGGFETESLAEAKLFYYIEVFYNRMRQHSTLGRRSPAEYEATLSA